MTAGDVMFKCRGLLFGFVRMSAVGSTSAKTGCREARKVNCFNAKERIAMVIWIWCRGRWKFRGTRDQLDCSCVGSYFISAC